MTRLTLSQVAEKIRLYHSNVEEIPATSAWPFESVEFSITSGNPLYHQIACLLNENGFGFDDIKQGKHRARTSVTCTREVLPECEEHIVYNGGHVAIVRFMGNEFEFYKTIDDLLDTKRMRIQSITFDDKYHKPIVAVLEFSAEKVYFTFKGRTPLS